MLNRERDILRNGKALIGRPSLTRGNLRIPSDHNLTVFNGCSATHHNACLVCTNSHCTFKFGDIFEDEGIRQVLIVREGTRTRKFLKDIRVIRVTIVIGKRTIQFHGDFANTVILQVTCEVAINNEFRIGVTQSFKRSVLVCKRDRARNDHRTGPSVSR